MARSSGSSAAAAILLALTLAARSAPPAAAASSNLPSAATGGDLSVDFHAASCPQLEAIVRSAVRAAVRHDTAVVAGLLRIFFLDCFPQGCDASVLLAGAGTEQAMGPHMRVHPRAARLIEDIRARVHATCGPTVSCADVVVLAARDAVAADGGPSYAVPLGRLDGLAPASPDDVATLPSPHTGSVPSLLATFGARGIDGAADLVALAGAHTVGRARCLFFADRAAAGDAFARGLAANCSRDPSRAQELDVITPDAFDNGYYVALRRNQGVFNSDMALARDPVTAPIVRRYAQSKDAFFTQFAASMVKLSKVPTKPAGNVTGEIRRNCFRTNGWSILNSGHGDAA